MEKKDEQLIIKNEDGVLTIKLNNPKKKNSFTGSMLSALLQTMDDALKNDDIKVIYFTSTGDMFSSGNDFNNFAELGPDQLIINFEKLITYLIEYPKVLIAGVNGPAIGVAFTMLNTFDIVLCSDSAIFMVPFIQTRQTPEGCSSWAFPLFLGKSTAGHLLLNGGALTAAEAKQLGFVTQIYEKEFFENDAYDYALKVAKHPLKNLMNIKRIVNRNFTKKMLEVNKEECKELRKCWDEKEFQTVIKKFVKYPKF